MNNCDLSYLHNTVRYRYSVFVYNLRLIGSWKQAEAELCQAQTQSDNMASAHLGDVGRDQTVWQS